MNGTHFKDELRRFFRRVLTAPLAMCAVLDDTDLDILKGAVEKRTARAEAAVLRDYFAQHGIEGEQAELAAEEYRQRVKRDLPDPAELDNLRRRAEEAEQNAVRAGVTAEARVQLARLGVPERHSADALLLASEELKAAEQNGGDPEAVRQALEAVVARLPGLAEPTGSVAGTTAGARGNFPRQDDAALTYQHSLDKARAAGDNAAAVGIITAAAAKGIALR